VVQQVDAPDHLVDGGDAEADHDVHQLLVPGRVEIDDPLGGPLVVELQAQFKIRGRNAARAAAAALAGAAADALERDQLGDDDAVGAEADRLDHVVDVAQPARGDQRDLVADPLVDQEVVDLRGDQRVRVHRQDPIDVLLVILDRVDAVERERLEERGPGARRGRAWRPART